VSRIQGLLKARRVNLTQEFEDPRPGGSVVQGREGGLCQSGIKADTKLNYVERGVG
jgi:hypothetical protein